MLPAASALPLLGHGLDAIVDVSDYRDNRPPTPEERLARYHDALLLRGHPADHDQRAVAGAALQRAMRLGLFPPKKRATHPAGANVLVLRRRRLTTTWAYRGAP